MSCCHLLHILQPLKFIQNEMPEFSRLPNRGKIEISNDEGEQAKTIQTFNISVVWEW